VGKLTGKVAIVTGAGRGIGRSIALALAAEGAKVVVASRTTSTVEAVADEIKGIGGEALGITCDVGERAQINTMIAEAVAHLKTFA
jgi:NAD(P)-dependent dehydrogenase (short-subunit alcohol dehydrogenase family)